MDHSGDTDGVVISKHAFFVDREIEEDDEGESVEEGEKAEKAEGKLKHGFEG